MHEGLQPSDTIHLTAIAIFSEIPCGNGEGRNGQRPGLIPFPNAHLQPEAAIV